MSKFGGAWLYFNDGDKIYFSSLLAMEKYLADNKNIKIVAMNITEHLNKDEAEKYLKELKS